jgi:Transposase DDE domain
MERERWETLYRMLAPWDHCGYRGLYSPAFIVAVYLWSAVHDRPVSWACQSKHWPADLLRRRLPSQPTMSRRLRQFDVQVLLTAIADQLRGKTDEAVPVKIIDAKPLPVSGYSKDPDARWGFAVRGLLKGYKLFAIWGNGPLPLFWCAGPMNTSEQRMAERMIPQLSGTGYLLGDKVYDINKLYDAASAVGHQLLADRKCPQAGLGNRRHSPARLRAISLLKTKKGRCLYRQRTAIERQFGGLTNFGGGLAPLPNWVRRQSRVQLWVHAKIILNALRINNLPRMTAIA